MAAFRKIVALCALLAALVLLFVVICPVTATPTAVITSRKSAPVTALSLVVAAASPLVALAAVSLVPTHGIVQASELFAPLTVLNRTCVRLC